MARKTPVEGAHAGTGACARNRIFSNYPEVAMFAYVVLGAVLLSAFLEMPASAQQRPQDYHAALKRACGQEINSLCKQIPDARGRLLACLYEHRASLSPGCEGFVWGSMDSLGKALERVKRVQRDCDRDERLYCKTVVEGGGHIVACLLIAPRVVSPQCKAAVYSVWDKKEFAARAAAK